MNDRRRIPCPTCGEMIRPAATRCRFCRAKLGNATGGVWRDGNKLVIEYNTILPEACIKTNLPTRSRLKRSFSWYPRWVLLTLPLGLIPCVILASTYGKKAKIEIPLAPEILRSRTRGIILAWLIFVMAIVAVTIAASQQSGSIAIGAVGLCLLASVVGIVSSNQVACSKITSELIWLKGASTEYLHELPEWEPR